MEAEAFPPSTTGTFASPPPLDVILPEMLYVEPAAEEEVKLTPVTSDDHTSRAELVELNVYPARDGVTV
jgi:hypothetical protein